MRKIYLVLSAVATILTLNSCSKGVDEKITPENSAQTILKGYTPQESRTHLDGLNVKWSTGDKLFVLSDTQFDKHTFTLASGEETSVATFSSDDQIEGNTFIAYYPASIMTMSGATQADSERKGLWYPRYDLPTHQTYVANGVDGQLLVMRAVGTDLANMEFEHQMGIIRLKLYDSSPNPAIISTVEITSTGVKKLAGSYYGDYINYTTQTGLYQGTFGQAASNATNTITLKEINTQLSNDPENPTILNIVVPKGKIDGFDVKLLDSKDGFIIKSKKSDLTITAGQIEIFPTFEYIASATPDISGLKLSIDGGEPFNYDYDEVLPVPSSSIVITTDAGSLLTSRILNQVAAAVAATTAGNSSISVDMSGSECSFNIFPEVFQNNLKLKSIKLPKNITIISASAFKGSYNLSSVTLNEGLLEIGDYAFQGTPIATLNIPASVTKIGWFQLRNTLGNEYVVDPANQKYSSFNGVLYNKDQTALIDYPKGRSETSFVIPSTVTSLNGYSIMETILESITIPASVKTISMASFTSCRKLAKIICQGTTPPSIASMAYVGVDVIGEKVIEVPVGCKEAYEAVSGWMQIVTEFGYVIRDGSTPAPASGSLAELGVDNSYAENGLFWK